MFLLPVNFGFELALIGNIIAIPAFLDRFGQETATGAIEISARDQQTLNAATTVGKLYHDALWGKTHQHTWVRIGPCTFSCIRCRDRTRQFARDMLDFGGELTELTLLLSNTTDPPRIL